ncbi:BMC domain-containing protein [Alkalicoccus daliensis]|uniref:BMC domain-containing protein n=2 Tax=Alkalicoccus daliensis TaxID=745820 RepID=A0A1H0HC83_9BACI|nr:BMC domain-containing protein [Alkalicoccus daliensis]
MNKALGMLEVLGFSVAIAAADQAVKYADVTIEGIDCNNPIEGDKAEIPLVVQVKFRGDIANVEMAMQAARTKALNYLSEDVVKTTIIPKTDNRMAGLLTNGKVKKKVIG